ncbi:carbonic anhydrase 15 [Lampris incognitus]|uniref:carbonic anhydrase 15 n=1 Tax=Lampris incognitus TaxID=2546036 RepID=UPI0024B48DA1|nr:carbonic anhydrase 15 [Lampris incognitus]
MILTASVLMIAIAYSNSEDFCYDEDYCDPYAWGDTFPSCHPLLEEHHSPINLNGQMTRNESLGPLRFEGFDAVQPGHWTLVNNGHSVVLELGSGMSVSGGSLPGVFQTIQLHFHWGSPSSNGSEHTIDRHRYPMEMHIVNMKSIHPNLSAALDDPTGLAVLGFFIDVAYADNVHFGHVTQKLSAVAYKGQKTSIKPFPLMNLLPEHNMSQYYRYHGSLTTPPCSPVVVWTLYEVPVYISWSQLEQFDAGIYSTGKDAEHATRLHNNFRHIHPTFSRVIYASKDAKILKGKAAHFFSSAFSLFFLQIALLGGFISEL